MARKTIEKSRLLKQQVKQMLLNPSLEYTQKQMANKLGVTEQTLSKWVKELKASIQQYEMIKQNIINQINAEMKKDTPNPKRVNDWFKALQQYESMGKS